jgi:hypothetical protein
MEAAKAAGPAALAETAQCQLLKFNICTQPYVRHGSNHAWQSGSVLFGRLTVCDLSDYTVHVVK